MRKSKAWFGRCLRQLSSWHFSWSYVRSRQHKLTVRVEHIRALVSLCVVFTIVGCITYWVMLISQVSFSANLLPKGVVFYETTYSNKVQALFGVSGFDHSRLILRGLVITGTSAGVNHGFVLIDVDGKLTGPIAVGEIVPPGIRLEKIEPDGVIVSHHGYDFHLQQ